MYFAPVIKISLKKNQINSIKHTFYFYKTIFAFIPYLHWQTYHYVPFNTAHNHKVEQDIKSTIVNCHLCHDISI